MSGGTRLERPTFTTSRMLDFFSEKELTAQTGHGPVQWPLVILKELADNALDASEEAGTPPQINVTVDADGITVTDNGPGIPPETIAGVLDYSVRVSSREAYAAPDRGAQGNALKTILAMPFVLDAGVAVPGQPRHRTARPEGHITVTARGTRHEITVRIDPIRQEPVIDHAPHPADVRTGTRITVHWPDSARTILDHAKGKFFQLAEDYLWLNPHLTLTADWSGENVLLNSATNPAWPKWTPSDPTSAWWYTPQTMERLIAAHVSDPAHKGMSVREFITQFRGLSGTAKGSQVLAETGLARTGLAGLVINETLDSARIAGLLEAMRRHSRPVKPAQLGVIGRDHLAARLAGVGAEMDSFMYKKTEGDDGGQPYVVEVAFAWRPDLGRSRLVTGINWSPGLVNPFRQIGEHAVSLDTVLQRQRADEDCVLVLHMARPVVTHANRGKSEVALPAGGLADAIIGGVESVTAAWAKQRKAEERHASARRNRRDVLTRVRRVTKREAAWRVMRDAYDEASSGGRYWANARQVFYKARPQILALTGLSELDSRYFTQDLLPDYVEEHGLEGAWKIAYDARGHFTEPHRPRLSGAMTRAALGTLEVRDYLGKSPAAPLDVGLVPLDYPTAGPENRYGGVVFIEKEGFDQQITESGLADKHDVAFMSTKGMSNTASRELVDYLAGLGVRIYTVRDFDRAGFTIAGTLTTSSRRYRFRNQADVTDLGLRLADVEEHGLDSEPWQEKVSPRSAIATLRRHGATRDEIGYLISGGDARYTWGRRVELNAFTTEQFIGWLDAKLGEHGAGKVIPGAGTLDTAWRRARMRHAVNRKIDEITASLRDTADSEPVPGDIGERVRRLLADDPAMSWDEAVAVIAADGGVS